MFNLNQAIAEWRQGMLAAGVTTTEFLDELESHLRDDVTEEMLADCRGPDGERAFAAACLRIGQAGVLQNEFKKIERTQGAPARVKRIVFTLAGIPNHYLNASMNTNDTNIEPRWATYLKAAGFLAPALFFWMASIVFVFPKLRQVYTMADGRAFPVYFDVVLAISQHWMLAGGAIAAVIGLLELRSRQWPRYRRAAVGAAAFLVNTGVLVTIFMMVVVALIAESRAIPVVH